ncbi:DUF6236 family protein [Anabaena sp. CCY 9910]|uniref:DUF6236 family protein n=1 Tax=Anabaena sp. CCY 9910 TaxID=3103870 RepID=UPI0039E02275
MAFTKALYYPWIDIRDEGWLKNAVLYWDHVHTIVPISVDNPYSNDTSQELLNEGLLSPFQVQSDMREIRDLTDDVFKYLDSQEGIEVLFAQEISETHRIHFDKIPDEIRELVEIHPDKLPERIRAELKGGLLSEGDEWITVDKRFASFYMTLLATRLSDQIGAGLLTDIPGNNKLANSAKLDSKLNLPKSRRHRYGYEDNRNHKDMPVSLSQGMLADLILERINIDPETPVTEIIKFRRRYADELGRFRVKIAKLTESVSNDTSFSRLHQQINDLYVNEVQPEINTLKRILSEQRINWVAENFIKVTFFSTGAVSLPHTVLGLSVPHALFVGAGISLIASAILYNRDKANCLRQNPFSYLLGAEKELKYKWLN